MSSSDAGVFVLRNHTPHYLRVLDRLPGPHLIPVTAAADALGDVLSVTYLAPSR